MKVLCETVAKCEIQLLDDTREAVDDPYLYRLLHYRTNRLQTPYMWLQTVVYHAYHYGNSYSYIKYDNDGHILELIPLDPRQMRIYVDDANIFDGYSLVYQFTDPNSGETSILLPDEVLHIAGVLPSDGIVGRCIRYLLAENMTNARKSQRIITKLYDNGLSPSAVLSYTGDLNQSKKQELLKSIRELMNQDVDLTSNRIIPLPLGMSLTPLSLKFSDTDFTTIRENNQAAIAAAFGVPLSMLNLKGANHLTANTDNIAFYTLTMQPLFTRIEAEMNRKLLSNKMVHDRNVFKFKVSDMLRTDRASLINELRGLTASGIYSINDARRELDLPAVENGDDHLVNGSNTSVEQGQLLKDTSSTKGSGSVTPISTGVSGSAAPPIKSQ